MSLDITLDVNVARLAHAEWELELERLIMGTGSKNAKHIHASCDLGKWIYARGLRKYGDINEAWELKNSHNKFHEIAEKIIRLKDEGEDEKALDMLDDIRSSSSEVIYLLTCLELAITHKQLKRPVLGQTWNLMSQFLGLDTDPKPFLMYLHHEDHPWYAFRKKKLSQLASVLDINAARLNHVMWVDNLTRSFTRFSRGKHIQSADECGLGHWMHSIGREEFLGDAEFEALDMTHREFHHLSLKTHTALHSQDTRLADRAYQKVIQASRDIVFQLTHLELKMQGTKIIQRRMRAIKL